MDAVQRSKDRALIGLRAMVLTVGLAQAGADAAPAVADLLVACAHLTVSAAGRIPLHVWGATPDRNGGEGRWNGHQASTPRPG